MNAETHRLVDASFFVLLTVLVASLLSFSVMLSKSLKKLKTRNEEITALNELRQTFIDADQNLIFLKDANLRYVFVNKSFKYYHQMEDSQIIGHDDFDILDDKEFARVRSRSDMDVLQNKMTVIDEFQWQNRIFLSTKFPVRLSNNQYGVGGYIKEVTNDYHNLRQLEDANRSLREKEEELTKLLKTVTEASYYDALTGLYNRRFFDEEIKRLDVPRNLPISIIVGDVNNLKLTNDIFGHVNGDLLLKKAAETMKRACRADDIISRWGGDEYGILLPRTRSEDAEVIAKRIKDMFSEESIQGITCSISLGIGTKADASESIFEIMKTAENRMYSKKVLEHRQNSRQALRTLMQNLFDAFPGEKAHAENVSRLCQKIGEALNLNESEIISLKETGLYHDIGKIIIDRSILTRDTAGTGSSLTEMDLDKIKMHPVAGYRILNSTDETLEIAGFALSHHERWDGTGYPRGLKGTAIPRLSRILAVAESYDAMTNGSFYKKPVTRKEALEEIRNNAGLQFDPEIVSVFLEIMAMEA